MILACQEMPPQPQRFPYTTMPRRIAAGHRRLFDSRLEQILQRELCYTSVTRTCKLADIPVAYGVRRVAKVRVVEEVEELAAELELPSLENRELLEQ